MLPTTPARHRRRPLATIGVALLSLLAACAEEVAGPAADPSSPVVAPGLAIYAGATAADLGTLGGPSSEIRALGPDGVAVGVSTNAAGERRAFRWTAAGMTDLGTLGGTESDARAIGPDGAIYGWARDGQARMHAFRWTQATGMQDLGTLGGSTSIAVAVGADGTVIGNSQTAAGLTHGFRWTAAGGMVDLGTLGGTTSLVTAIAANGDVIGTATTAAGQSHAARWVGTTITDLGTLGGTSSEVVAFAADGSIIGVAQNAANQPRAFRWTGGTLTDLGSLGGPWSRATAAGPNGVVVGYSLDAAGRTRSFRWTAATGMTDLGGLAENNNQALGIGADGLVVGVADSLGGGTHAVFWWPGAGIYDLAANTTRASTATIAGSDRRIAGFTLDGANRRAIVWTMQPNRAPVVNVGGPYSVVEGGTLTLAATVTDADGDPITSSGWTRPDNSTATGPQLVQPFGERGTFQFTFAATDARGLSTSAAATVTVTNAGPRVGRLEAPARMAPARRGTFAVDFTDASRDRPWEVTFEWGDGTRTTRLVTDGRRTPTGSQWATTPAALVRSAAAVHAYAAAGSYEFRVIVKDRAGASSERTRTITVAP